MDITKAVRSPEKVRATLKRVGDQLITLKGCSIVFPKSYEDKQLAYMGGDISLIGVYALFIDDVHYSVSLAPSRFPIGNCLVEVITIAEVEYYKLTFSPGSVVLRSVHALKVKVFSYDVVNYFIDYGRVPWFLNYVDTAEICRDIRYWCNISLGGGQACFDVLITLVARTHEDIRSYYRLALKTEADLFKHPRFIPVMEKSLTATSTLARVTGGELKKSIRETLLDTNDTREPLEDLYVI